MKIEPPAHERNATWLRAFLLEKKVRKLHSPWDLSDRALMWLALHIFACTHIQHTPPPTPHPTFPGTVTKGAIECVRNGLERQREAEVIQLASWSGHPDTPDDPFVRTNMDRVSETINRIAVALSVVDELKLPARKPRKAWHYWAAPLARKFIWQARECGHSFGIANDGPVARYVHAVIPLITSEQPKLSAVAQFLKEHRTEILEG